MGSIKVPEHTQIGARILDGSESDMIKMARDIALAHHERWDGLGYPQGLEREAIPAPARIVGIIDVYDALVHDRVYRPAFSQEDALSIMDDERDTGKFDPKMFEAFLRLIPEMRSIGKLITIDGDSRIRSMLELS